MNLKTDVAPKVLSHRSSVTGLHCGSPGGGMNFIYPDELATNNRMINAGHDGGDSGLNAARHFTRMLSNVLDYSTDCNAAMAKSPFTLHEHGWASLVLQCKLGRSETSSNYSSNSSRSSSVSSVFEDRPKFGRRVSVFGSLVSLVTGRRSSRDYVAKDPVQLQRVRRTPGCFNAAFDGLDAGLVFVRHANGEISLDPKDMLRLPKSVLAVRVAIVGQFRLKLV